MKTYKVVIRSTTPVLQHRFSESDEVEKSTRRVHIIRGTPREEAEKVCYRDKNGGLYFPGACISGVLREAGSGHKQRGSRKSMKYVIPAAVLVSEDAIAFHTPPNGVPVQFIKEFEVDSRPVVIPATKGRVMRHRPRLDEWAATFHVKVNELIMDPEMVLQLLTEGGQQQGIGDYRPNKGGPFGTFQVVSWEEIK